jgi:hypothetical protein
LGHISDIDFIYENYNVQFTRLSDILYEIATDHEASFYISSDKKFYFEKKNDFIQVDPPAHLTDLELEIDNGELRTVQYVLGASEETSLQSESKLWGEASGVIESTMTLAYQVSDIAGTAINAIPVNFGIRGVDDGDSSITFLYELGSNIISVNPGAAVMPAKDDIVNVVYQGFFDIIISSSNDALISELNNLNGTSGIIENAYTDESIDNLLDAENKATALLNNNNERQKEITVYCHDLQKSELFTVWSLNYQDLNIKGDFVIVERTIRSWGKDYEIILKMKSRNFFKQYGTVFKKIVDKKGKDIKVYKSASLSDNINIGEVFNFEFSGLVFYPTVLEFSTHSGLDDVFIVAKG